MQQFTEHIKKFLKKHKFTEHIEKFKKNTEHMIHKSFR